MGLPMTPPAHADMRVQHLPTPLLSHIAGGYAPELSGIWPAPHAGFLTLPTARRHAAAVLIDKATAHSIDLAGLLAFDRDDAIGELIVPGAGAGIMKILGRLGETLWAPEQYRVLLTLHERTSATKLLRHGKLFEPEMVQAAARLPEAFLHLSIVSALSSTACADDLVEALEVIERFDGEKAARTLANAMARAKSPVAMMDKVGEALQPNAFGLSVPVPNLPQRFHRIVDRKQLREAALAFRNCLESYAGDIACGQTQVYIVQAEPKVVVGIDRDCRGWMLREAQLAGNDPVPKPLLRDMARELEQAGVRVGTELGDLKRRLHAHVCDNCRTPDWEPYPNYRQQLKAGS